MLAVHGDTTPRDTDSLRARITQFAQRLGQSPDLLLLIILANLGMVPVGLAHGVAEPRGLLVNLGVGLFTLLVFEYSHGPRAIGRPAKPFRETDAGTGDTHEQ